MKRKETLTGICFILPGLIGFIIFILIPGYHVSGNQLYPVEFPKRMGRHQIYRIKKLFETV